MKAVVLLSGGLDSTTCLAIARERGFEPVCLVVAYGQRHVVELAAARRVVKAMGVRDVRQVAVDLRAIGGSALTDTWEVPKGRDEQAMAAGVPTTYVPARNALLLSLAAGLAEVVGAEDLFIGVNAVDYSGYPDCRPEFIRAFEEMARVGTRAGASGKRLSVHAPLSGMSKAEIVREGARLGVDFRLTHSCYDPSLHGKACGLCDSCLLRKKGFREAGVADPTEYQNTVEA